MIIQTDPRTQKEFMETSKKQISILLPYILRDDQIDVYLQKRSLTQKSLPGYFGFWGGHAEPGESPEKALQREIKEEMGLDIDIDSVTLFNRYEFLRNIKHIYLFKPSENWDSTIVIGEGDYGQWFNLKDAFKLENLIYEDKVVLNDLERMLLSKPIR